MPENKHSKKLVEAAQLADRVTQRSISEQIEHWVRIGKTAEENPDFPIDFIIGTLQSNDELNAGAPREEYKFGEIDPDSDQSG